MRNGSRILRSGESSAGIELHSQTHRSIARHLEATEGDSNDRKSPLNRMLVPNCTVAACREPSKPSTVAG